MSLLFPINFKRASRLAITISLLLAAPETNFGAQAMDITDETTHEQVYTNTDESATASALLEKDIAAQPEESAPITPPEEESVKEEEPKAEAAESAPAPEEAQKEQEENPPTGGEKQAQEEIKEQPPVDEVQLADDEDDQGPKDDPVVSVVDNKKEGDFVEESDTDDGRHVRKEVHQGPGFKTVRITTSGGVPGGPPGMGGRGPSLMQAMMQDMMQQMAGMAQKQAERARLGNDKQKKEHKEHRERVMQINGPMGRVVVRKSIPIDADDDDEDHEPEGIPPEILEMIRVTEAMHSRAGGGMGPFGAIGRPRQLRLNKGNEKDNTPRHEESHDEIMAKMNKLSEEIGERHDRDKLTKLKEKKSMRFVQVLAGLGGVLLIMVVSFVISCKYKGGQDSEVEEDQQSARAPGMNRRVGKAD